jgi:hypothetical protein
MKKYFYSLFIALFFICTACHNANVQTVQNGVCVIGKCCKNLQLKHGSKQVLSVAENEAGTNFWVDAPFPVYSWDSKMMFY